MITQHYAGAQFLAILYPFLAKNVREGKVKVILCRIVLCKAWVQIVVTDPVAYLHINPEELCYFWLDVASFPEPLGSPSIDV